MPDEVKQQSESTLPALRGIKRFFDLIYRTIFGFDYFIAYTWKDKDGRDQRNNPKQSGRFYAESLRKELQNEKHDLVCFLDSEDFEKGQNWQCSGQRALRGTSRLIVILSPGIAESVAVREEVAFFKTFPDRSIIPVTFPCFNASESCDWVNKLVPNGTLAVKEDDNALMNGPTAAAVSDLVKTFDLMRQNVFRRRLMGAAIGVLSVLLIVAVVAYNAALNNLAKASRETANVHWQLAVNARDSDADGIKASHFFLHAAAAMEAIPACAAEVSDVAAKQDFLLAAYFASTSHSRSFLHDGFISGAVFNDDESRLLTWSADKTARLWDPTKTEPIQTFEHWNWVTGAAFCRDPAHVLTWSRDGAARLWEVTKPEPIQTFRHEDAVVGAHFSLNESHLLTWSDDKTARLWDMSKSELIQTFKHDAPVIGARFSRDEYRVLTWGQDKSVRLWSVTEGELIHDFKHPDDVYGAQFESDDSLILSWGNSQRTTIWDPTKLDPVASVGDDRKFGNGDSDRFCGAQFSPDRSKLLTWGKDKAAVLWDVSNKTVCREFAHERAVNGARFDNNGLQVLTWSNDGTVKLWNSVTGELNQSFKHDAPVEDAQFSRDESRLLTRSGNKWVDPGMVFVWDVARATKPMKVIKHHAPVNGVRFSSDESHVLSWSGDYEGSAAAAQLWGVTEANPIRTLKHDNGPVYGAEFSHDESRVLSWGYDKTARIWDVEQKKLIRTFNHDNGPVYGAQTNKDKTRVLTWSRNWLDRVGEVRLWDVTKAEPIYVLNYDGYLDGSRLSEDESCIHAWGWELDGTGSAVRWDRQTGLQHSNERYGKSVAQTRLTHDATKALTWNRGNEVKLFDVKRDSEIHCFQHASRVVGARFNRDESKVWTWSEDKTARLWNPINGKAVSSFQNDSGVVGVQLNLDESRVLIWCQNHTARLYDVHSGKLIQIFRQSTTATGAQFSRDGFRVLTWSPDEIRLWGLANSQPIHTFNQRGRVFSAQFNESGNRILTTGESGTIRIWECSDPLADLSTAERILELEVRSGTTVDSSQNLRTLKFDEWQLKAKSAEYQALQNKLVANQKRKDQASSSQK